MTSPFPPAVSRGITTVARLVIGIVFAHAALDKIANPDAFAHSIMNYNMVPLSMVNLMALILPWLELLAGTALVLGIWVRASAAVSGALLLVFIGAISAAMIQGLNINCGCFSQTGEGTKVGWPKVLENTGMTILAVWAVLFPDSYASVEQWNTGSALSEEGVQQPV